MAKTKQFWRRLLAAIPVPVLLILSLSAQSEETTTRSSKASAKRAEKIFLEAKSHFQKESNNDKAAWQFGRACFDWAEFAAKNEQREEIANLGINACRQAIALRPKSVEGHYYLAMNLGQLARTKSLGALKLVSEMEKEFQLALGIDEHFDFAGPNRNLGLLYYEAPGWPTSIGNRSKARKHLHRAAQLSPDYPENRLNLLEAYLKWGEKNEAQREFNALKELWPAAKKEFSGEQWESSWADWENRWEKLQMKFSESNKALDAPRHKK
jgi:tetratricopeptide (TPR) repeat protein